MRVCVCVFVPPAVQRTDNSQDEAASPRDLGSGGALLSGQRRFLSVRQDRQPQPHPGQERRVRPGPRQAGGALITAGYLTLFARVVRVFWHH